jgi:hypothetical protein
MRSKARTLSLSVVLGLIATALIPSISYAAAASCSATDCTDEIDRIYVSQGGAVYVGIEDRSLAAQKLKCTLVSGWYFTLPTNHPNFHQIFSLLMEAKSRPTSTGRNRVTIRILDNSPNCQILYAFVNWPND